MARITIEDCLKRVSNRFLLSQMVAKRVKQIREGSEYLVNSPKNEDVVVALREIAAGKVRIKKDTDAKNTKDTVNEPDESDESDVPSVSDVS